jgi:small subunit ribosomal protein S13
MPYIFEVKLSEKKPILYALTEIYGLSCSRSSLICKKLGFSKNFKTKKLSKEQINKLLRVIDSLNFKLANELKKLELLKLKKLVFIKSYKGFRRKQGLPVRGQRTHTNAKTSHRIR